MSPTVPELRRWVQRGTWIALALTIAAPAGAQTRRSPATGGGPRLALRAFADVGRETFTAQESFRAVLGSPSGRVVGGGVNVLLPHGLFSELRVSRFRATGERVFAFGGQVYRLGIPDTVTIAPIELTGGYRWAHRRWRVTPFGGGGVGWHRYTETSPSAVSGDDVSQTFTSLHVMGGAELRLTRWIGASGDVRWTTVRHALGGADGLGDAFDETNLGGTSLRATVVIGRSR